MYLDTGAQINNTIGLQKPLIGAIPTPILEACPLRNSRPDTKMG